MCFPQCKCDQFFWHKLKEKKCILSQNSRGLVHDWSGLRWSRTSCFLAHGRLEAKKGTRHMILLGCVPSDIFHINRPHLLNFYLFPIKLHFTAEIRAFVIQSWLKRDTCKHCSIVYYWLLCLVWGKYIFVGFPLLGLYPKLWNQPRCP